MQVSATNGVMVGDNNCMHIQNSHSGRYKLKFITIQKKLRNETECNHVHVARMWMIEQFIFTKYSKFLFLPLLFQELNCIIVHFMCIVLKRIGGNPKRESNRFTYYLNLHKQTPLSFFQKIVFHRKRMCVTNANASE